MHRGAECSGTWQCAVWSAGDGEQCSDAVDDLLRALTVKVEQCAEKLKLDAQAVGNGLYGLQRMESNAAVDSLLLALTVKVEQCREKLSGQEVGNALYGRRLQA